MRKVFIVFAIAAVGLVVLAIFSPQDFWFLVGLAGLLLVCGLLASSKRSFRSKSRSSGSSSKSYRSREGRPFRSKAFTVDKRTRAGKTAWWMDSRTTKRR